MHFAMNTIRTNSIASTRGLGRASLLAAALLTALFFGVACGGEEGTSPACVQDIYYDAGPPNADAGGVVHDNLGDKGCNPFATCFVNNQPAAASECCKNVGGGDKNSYDYQACMYGYGAGPEPGTGK